MVTLAESPPLVRASRMSLMHASLMRFFASPSNAAVLVAHLTGRATVSLRLIDWFVTSFSKSHAILIPHFKDDATPAGFTDVYASYRMQLRSLTKTYFDPFRRHNRISVRLECGETVVTTIGQLNFFKWLIESGIVRHIHENAEAIERAMREAQETRAATASTGTEAPTQRKESQPRASTTLLCGTRVELRF